MISSDSSTRSQLCPAPTHLKLERSTLAATPARLKTIPHRAKVNLIKNQSRQSQRRLEIIRASRKRSVADKDSRCNCSAFSNSALSVSILNAATSDTPSRGCVTVTTQSILNRGRYTRAGPHLDWKQELYNHHFPWSSFCSLKWP